MPYLRITCPDLDEPSRKRIAHALTQAVNDLFYHPRARQTRDELRERTTIHFAPYSDQCLFIGGRTPVERGLPDITVELSDWNMSVRQQRRVAAALTPCIAQCFGVPGQNMDAVNIRFHPYPPTDFAVGGKLLSDLIPKIGQAMKRWLQ